MTRWMVALLVLAAASLTAIGQDVEPKYTSGDKATISVDSTLELEIVTTDGEGKTPRGVSVIRKEKYSQELQEVAGGKPHLLQVKCLEAKFQRGSWKENPAKVTSPIEGQTYLVTLGGKPVVRTLSGDLAPSEAAAIGGWEDLVKWLPAKGTAVGGKWDVKASDAGSAFWFANLEGAQGAISCTYASNADGKATVTFTGTVKGKTRGEIDPKTKKPQEGFDVTLEISSGTYVFNTASGKSVSCSIKGKLEMSKKPSDEFQKPDTYEKEQKEYGEIKVTSKKLEVNIAFE